MKTLFIFLVVHVVLHMTKIILKFSILIYCANKYIETILKNLLFNMFYAMVTILLILLKFFFTKRVSIRNMQVLQELNLFSLMVHVGMDSMERTRSLENNIRCPGLFDFHEDHKDKILLMLR